MACTHSHVVKSFIRALIVYLLFLDATIPDKTVISSGLIWNSLRVSLHNECCECMNTEPIVYPSSSIIIKGEKHPCRRRNNSEAAVSLTKELRVEVLAYYNKTCTLDKRQESEMLEGSGYSPLAETAHLLTVWADALH